MIRPRKRCTISDIFAILITAAIISIIFAIVFAMTLLGIAHARDSGQWENQDPYTSRWFKSLMQPDNPSTPCCGEADAYWADGIEVKDGQTIATITDDRDDGPLGRHHVPIGTRIVVPAHKLKWDRGNPTGHTVIFLSIKNDVYCYVQGTGI